MSNPYQYLEYEVTERIGYLTLNRPDKRNALNHDMIEELKLAIRQAEADNNVKVIVLRANGKAFSAGADLAYLQQLQNFTFEENLEDSNHLMELFLMIHQLKKVVIAQIEGHAIAGGCGLATICDISFTVPEAKFGYTEVKIGFVPALVTVFLLPKIGEAKAKRLLLSGELIDAATAQSMGLVNFVEPAATIKETVKTYALQLCKNASGQSLAYTKQLIDLVMGKGMAEGLDSAALCNAEARSSDDCKAGIAAFLNKESLEW